MGSWGETSGHGLLAGSVPASVASFQGRVAFPFHCLFGLACCGPWLGRTAHPHLAACILHGRASPIIMRLIDRGAWSSEAGKHCRLDHPHSNGMHAGAPGVATSAALYSTHSQSSYMRQVNKQRLVRAGNDALSHAQHARIQQTRRWYSHKQLCSTTLQQHARMLVTLQQHCTTRNLKLEHKSHAASRRHLPLRTHMPFLTHNPKESIPAAKASGAPSSRREVRVATTAFPAKTPEGDNSPCASSYSMIRAAPTA